MGFENWGEEKKKVLMITSCGGKSLKWLLVGFLGQFHVDPTFKQTCPDSKNSISSTQFVLFGSNYEFSYITL